VLLGGQRLSLGGKEAQGTDDLDAGLVRGDHCVDVAALGSHVGVGERVLVVGDQLGPALLDVAALLLNLRKASIYGGSNEIQRQIIAGTILGL
jgi:alkylation response protein AidB-like acyl-CoA dehydrogenase